MGDIFLIAIHSMQGSAATTRHGVPRKRITKHTGNLFRKKLQKATKIIGQRKTFYRQRIPEKRNCARKETVDIAILVTSRNGDRKIMQSI